jgi:hypothetical protein
MCPKLSRHKCRKRYTNQLQGRHNIKQKTKVCSAHDLAKIFVFQTNPQRKTTLTPLLFQFVCSSETKCWWAHSNVPKI